MVNATSITPSRIALIAAALIALAAAGAAIWRSRPAPAPLAPAAAPQGDIAAMISSLEAKLKANPRDAEGWRMLGWSFFETGRYAESATAYRRAAQLDPAKAEYWASLGEALVLAGPGDVPADARAAFQTALQRDSTDPRSRYFLAVAKDMAGDHRGAIDDWIALLKDTPAGAPWEADVRRLVAEVGAREKIEVASRLTAIQSTAPAIAAIPGPTADQMRAASQLPPGQQEAMVTGMVDSLAAKLAANPQNVDGWIMLMRSRVQLGQAREAGEVLRSAIAANPAAAGQLKGAARELGISG